MARKLKAIHHGLPKVGASKRHGVTPIENTKNSICNSFPPAPSVYEWQRSLLLRKRGHKRVQGVFISMCPRFGNSRVCASVVNMNLLIALTCPGLGINKYSAGMRTCAGMTASRVFRRNPAILSGTRYRVPVPRP
jgi:hypothetical protein